MSRIIIEMHQRPTRLAIILIIAVMLPVWWLTGDFSPLASSTSLDAVGERETLMAAE